MTECADDLFKRLDPDGRYENVEQIGSGGMGTVYRALDTRLQIQVAFKVLHQSSVQALVRFQQEARALSCLQHDGIVKIFDFFPSEDEVLLIMEYVDGKTVRQILDEIGTYQPDEALRITLEVCRALRHAHDNGIVHRDVKPDNVMVTTDGAVKILDFGIAKLLQTNEMFGTLTRSGQLIGSPLYMSPEQLQGQEATVQTDVYGLGLLLFHMVTNRSPFSGETVTTMLEERLYQTTAKLAEILPDQPIYAEIDKVLEVALAPEPSNRHKNMAALESDLKVLIGLSSQLNALDERARESNPDEDLHTGKSSKRALLIIPIVAVAVVLIPLATYFALPSENLKVLNTKHSVKQSTPIEILPTDLSVDELDSDENPDIAPPGFTIDDDNGTRGISFCKAKEPITDEKLKKVEDSKIRYLSFAGSSSLKSAHIKMLAGVPVSALDLRSTTVDIEGLSALRNLPQLNWLILDNSNFSNESAEALGTLPKLSNLELHNCRKLTDDGLKTIVENNPNLNHLDIGETSITTLKPLQHLKKLRLLRAGRTAITDGDIAYLKEPLRDLYIIGCPNITDKSLQSLGKIETLRLVALKGCPKISELALRRFREETGCRVGLNWKTAKQKPRVQPHESISDSFADLDSLDEAPSTPPQ